MCVCILGAGNIKATEVADAMFDAVIDVLSQNSSTTLNTVRIVIFQAPMLTDFYTSMQQREASVTKLVTWFGSTLSKLKGKNYTGNNVQVRISSSLYDSIFVLLLEPYSQALQTSHKKKAVSSKVWRWNLFAFTSVANHRLL